MNKYAATNTWSSNMNKILVTATLLCLSLAAAAGESIDQSLDAATDGYVKIEHVNGYAHIKGWDKDQVKVVGELSDRTDEIIFERRGNGVVFKVKEKKNKMWDNWDSSDGDKLEIYVPMQSKLNYEAVNANVEVQNILGGADIETVNGHIKANKLAGRTTLGSVNGDIDASELSGDLKIETVNGDIKSRSNSGKEDHYESVNGNINISSESTDMSVETVNGNIELNLSKVQNLSLETVNGHIEANMELRKNGDVRASTVGGTVELNFQKDVSARFDIQAHAGGNIKNSLSDDRMKKAKYGPSRWLEFTLNGGDARVEISTVSGSIRLDHK
jgi:DUF4097 and DUF4098 domain-containing protein YvlB